MPAPAWSSVHWFRWDTLREFAWGQPLFLYGIVAVPLLFLFRWLLVVQYRQKLAVAFPSGRLRWSPVGLLRFVPDLLVGGAVALVLVALARPQRVQQRVELFSEGIDIMLVLDVSQSMLAEDFRPNRLEAAKRVARDFIGGRFQDRIGLVVFAGDAFSLAPLTTDYALLNALLDDIRFGTIRTPGTAIGSALAVAVNRMRPSKAKTKVVILISDGDNTGGNLDPRTAATLASMYNIRLYSILVGQEGQVPVRVAGKLQYETNTIDESTLRAVAETGDGRFYRAADGRALQEVFSQIDRFEKSKVQEMRFRDTEDYYTVYLRWAVVLLVVWMLSKATFISNVLED
ncbi:MAG TPA: VWA domain-containing protein [Cytophagales bacterium]